MVLRAYVLTETEVGKTKEVVEAIKKLEGVVVVDSVTGPYDVILTIERDNINQIGELVTTKIQLIKGISRTVICLAVNLP